MVYNMGSGILRAVGDSRRPFYYLLVSAAINIVLDLLFVHAASSMGVAGVALCHHHRPGRSQPSWRMATLLRAGSCVRIIPAGPQAPRRNAAKGRLGGHSPPALQMAVTSFSNVFVQSYINYFGPERHGRLDRCITKVDQLRILPIQSLAIACHHLCGAEPGRTGLDGAGPGKGVRTSPWPWPSRALPPVTFGWPSS